MYTEKEVDELSNTLWGITERMNRTIAKWEEAGVDKSDMCILASSFKVLGRTFTAQWVFTSGNCYNTILRNDDKCEEIGLTLPSVESESNITAVELLEIATKLQQQ